MRIYILRQHFNIIHKVKCRQKVADSDIVHQVVCRLDEIIISKVMYGQKNGSFLHHLSSYVYLCRYLESRHASIPINKQYVGKKWPILTSSIKSYVDLMKSSSTKQCVRKKVDDCYIIHQGTVRHQASVSTWSIKRYIGKKSELFFHHLSSCV